MKSRSQALRDLGLVIAEIAARTDHLTPREAAERAWEPSNSLSLDELETQICDARRSEVAEAVRTASHRRRCKPDEETC